MAFLPGNRITGINIKARFANDLHLATTQARLLQLDKIYKSFYHVHSGICKEGN
jgi:hypothetical protein